MLGLPRSLGCRDWLMGRGDTASSDGSPEAPDKSGEVAPGQDRALGPGTSSEALQEEGPHFGVQLTTQT